MHKIVRYKVNCKRLLQPILVYDKQYLSKVGYIKTYNVCNMCTKSLLHFGVYTDALNVTGLNLSILRTWAAKYSQEVLIEGQSEINQIKRFLEIESMFHHEVLEELSAYANTLFKEDLNFNEKYRISHEEFKDLKSTGDWCNKSPKEIATAFISFAIYSDSYLKLSMDDEQFNELAIAFVNKCSEFNDEQLIDSMIAIKIWPMSKHVKENNYCKIWKSLDRVCIGRSLDWTIDKSLYMIDLWYHMKLIRLSEFVFKGLNRISRKCKDLTRAQMVQVMFYMSCVRKLHPAICMREYEHYLQKHITYLTIEEIGIFNLAFFKTKTSILQEKLLLYTSQRVVQEVHTIPEVTLTAIAKALRFSLKPQLGFTLNDMVKIIGEERMSSLKLVTTIHIAHIGSKIHFFNEQVLTKLAEKLCANPSDARLKDMDRVVFLLSIFNYIPPTTPDIFNLILEQLDLQQHVAAREKHPLNYVSLVYYLTLLRIFPEKHIRHLLSEEFINKHFDSKFVTPVQMLQIDYNRVLEGPKGSEHLLSPSMREYLARKNSVYTPNQKFKNLSNFDKMLAEVIDVSKAALGGEANFLVTYTLPYTPRADILFRLDSEGRPIAIPEELRLRKPFEDVLKPSGDGWRCVVVASRNMYMFNVPKLVGEVTTKLRQLTLLGYTPIVIPYHYWMSNNTKLDYLKLKYFNTSVSERQTI